MGRGKKNFISGFVVQKNQKKKLRYKGKNLKTIFYYALPGFSKGGKNLKIFYYLKKGRVKGNNHFVFFRGIFFFLKIYGGGGGGGAFNFLGA